MKEVLNSETISQAVLWLAHEELKKIYSANSVLTERQADILNACRIAIGRNYQPSDDMTALLSAIIAAPLAVNA